MEVFILGNPYDPLLPVTSPITVPAYQADQAVIQLSGSTSPINIGIADTATNVEVNEYSIQTFSISNGITTSVVLTNPTSQIILLTINGLEYYQTLDWILGSDEKTITFLVAIPYSSTYGNSIVKVVYTQVATSRAFLNGSQIFFDNTGTTIPYEDVQDAIVYIYNHSIGSYASTVNGVAPIAGNITLLPSSIGAESSLGNPSVNGYILSSTTGGVRSWIAPPTNSFITSLTTSGSSGSSSVNTGVLNIPTYTLSGLGGQSSSNILTALAGLSYSTAANVRMTGASTFTLDTNVYALNSALSNYPLTSSLGTGAYATIANYLTISSASSTYQSLNSGLTSISGLSYVSSSFLKLTGTNTYTLDTNTYLTTSSATSTYQPISTNLTSIGSLSNATGYLYNNGSGTFSYSTPSQYITSLTTTGSSGAATVLSGVLNIPQYSTGAVTMSQVKSIARRYAVAMSLSSSGF
jgi:hypothetical protein